MGKFIVRALSCVSLLLVALSAQAQQYSLTDLGTLGGTLSGATGINSSGQVVGYSVTSSDPNSLAFLYSNGSMQNLGTLGGPASYAFGINSAGQVVGYSATSANEPLAFLYSNGSMQNLNALLGAEYSWAYGINATGQVVGWFESSPGNEHAFLYSNGSTQDLNALLGGTSESAAYGINATGQVVGRYVFPATNGYHAFLYSNGSYVDLGTLCTTNSTSLAQSQANGINTAGQVVGDSQTCAINGYHAFLYSNGTMQDLGTLGGEVSSVSSAEGINAAGQVVGSSSTTGGSTDYHAFLYSNGKMIDLNTLDTSSPLAAEVTLNDATAINDNGWIVANGIDSSKGTNHAYLLIPVAAPTAVAGANQTVSAGTQVSLNGLGSYAPNTPSASLEYAWSFVAIPSGSSAVLSGANTATPSFFADEPGTYVVQLIVTDPTSGLSSKPSLVTISTTWTPPAANAGPGQSVVVGTRVLLSGSGTDPNGLALSYAWSFVSVPSGSTATLANANTQNASFEPNVVGTYTVELIVSDSVGSSAPSTVTISVISAANYAQQQIANAINYVANMPVSQFQAAGHRESMINLLQEAIAAIQAGDTVLANHKLTSAISRTDGYPLRGAVDGQGPGMDWIIDPTAQNAVYADLLNALNVLP